MNRAFVKEPDEGAPAEGLPERQISEHENYVTPAGLRELETRVGELETRRLELLEGDDPRTTSSRTSTATCATSRRGSRARSSWTWPASRAARWRSGPPSP